MALAVFIELFIDYCHIQQYWSSKSGYVIVCKSQTEDPLKTSKFEHFYGVLRSTYTGYSTASRRL